MNAQGNNSGKDGRPLAELMFGVGFTMLLAQILLMREAGVWLRGNEFVVACILGVWLAWVAAGTAAGYALSSLPRARHGGARHDAAVRDRMPPAVAPAWRLAIVFWWLSVAASLAILIALRCFWAWTSGMAGHAFNLGRAAYMALLLTALPCLLGGAAAGAAARLLEHVPGRTVAWLYLWETLGACTAGLASTFILIPAGKWWFTLACLPAALLALRGLRQRRLAPAGLALALMAAGLACNGALQRYADAMASRLLGATIVLNHDAPRVRLTVTRRHGETAFFFNGRLAGSSVARENAEELASYASLAAHGHGRASVIGFPYNGLVRELAARAAWVDVIDPEAELLAGIAPHLRAEDARALTQPHVRVLEQDPRAWFHACAKNAARGTPGSNGYDIVIIDAGVPDSYAAARLYSEQFYRDVREALAPGGVVMVVLPGSAGYVPDDLARLLARARNTLGGVCGNATLIPATSALLFARKGPAVSDDPAWWLERSGTNMPGPWFSPALLRDHLNPYRVNQFRTALSRFAAEKPQRDLAPRMYGDALRYYEARFAHGIGGVLAWLYDSPQRALVVTFALFTCWALAAQTCAFGAWRRTQLALTGAAVAMAGLTSELLVIARFVVVRGSPYHELGVLFAAYMLGLSLAVYECGRRRPLGGPSGLLGPAGALCLVLCAATMLPWPAGHTAALAVSGVFIMLSGCACGACFALLAARARETRGGGATLYAADVAGAMAGAALFSIVVPPVLGFQVLALMLSVLVVVVALVWGRR
ncbi:hypothetical protein GX586_14485 [bacterium]|nr:hypothetical protein [bacterium]